MPNSPVIVWFRLDLRLSDHPALVAATETGRPVIPLFVHDDTGADDRLLGAGSRAWLRRSLPCLEKDLKSRGSSLILRRGPALEIIPRLIEKTGANAVYWNERVEPGARGVSERLANRLGRRHVEVRVFPADWLHPPGDIVSGQGTAYRVFTPFSRACFAAEEPPSPLPIPRRWLSPRQWPATESVEELLPESLDEPRIPESFKPGERSAHRRLKRFLADALEAYPAARDQIDQDGTSALSPHLHFGEISAREVWHAVRSALDGQRSPAYRTGGQAFLRQLLWREFAMLTLLDHPDMAVEPIQEKFADFGWRTDPSALSAWKAGLTGYPIVDAAMRQLTATGCMHNRLRMIVASFLCKHLLIHWSEGERWFRERLLDADPANNAFGWQWVSGCGLDAAPFIRVFNPVLQGRKFDARGAYVAQWLPELGRLPPKHIHEPWSAPPKTLQSAGVDLGGTYPEPIVDHRAARNRALMAFETIRTPKP